jgi:hypothetical protein
MLGDKAKRIPLTKGKYAVVDAEDHERICHVRWFYHASGSMMHGRAETRITLLSRSQARMQGRAHQRGLPMTHILLCVPPGMVVDHINHDPLDNRKSNLRICTARENSINRQKQRQSATSRYKGVWRRRTRKHPSDGKWRAGIRIHKKLVELGRFDNEAEAAMAYDDAARKAFGPFADLNFPRSASNG